MDTCHHHYIGSDGEWHDDMMKVQSSLMNVENPSNESTETDNENTTQEQRIDHGLDIIISVDDGDDEEYLSDLEEEDNTESTTIQHKITAEEDDDNNSLLTKANLMSRLSQLEAQKAEEEMLRIRISEMEHELAMRKARTDRLRAMVNIVTSWKQYHASSQAVSPTSSSLDLYHHQPHYGGHNIKERVHSLPMVPPLVPTLEMDTPLVILRPSVSPAHTSSSSSSDSDIESLLDLLNDDDDDCSPSPSKKHRF